MRLIDADALKKEIRENDPFGGMNYEWFIDHAPTVAASSPWHRVEEPPKNTGHYLTCYVDGDIALNWWNDKWGWMFETKTVSYWMPLPEPPKEDA